MIFGEEEIPDIYEMDDGIMFGADGHTAMCSICFCHDIVCVLDTRYALNSLPTALLYTMDSWHTQKI